MKIRLNKVKQSKGFKYNLCLISEYYYYYINYSQTDFSKNTLMYSRETDVLISDNNFAYISLKKEVEGSEALWISPKLKRNINTNP